MTSRTEKLRRRQHRKDKKRRRPSSGGPFAPVPGGPLLIRNPRGQAKMSAVLLDLLKPELDECADMTAMEKVFDLGVTAWNASLMEKSDRSAMLDESARSLPSDLRERFYQYVELIALRKQKLYPHLKRPILSFDLSMRDGAPYLEVMSGL
jgi:hypothetical protein